MIRLFTIAALLAMAASASAASAPGDEQLRLLRTLTQAIEPRLASDGRKLADGDYRLLKRAAYLPEFSYFPVDRDALNVAVTAAIRDEPRSDFPSLLRAGLNSIIASVGNGAKVLENRVSKLPEAGPSAEDLGEFHVVHLPSFGKLSTEDEPRCRKLIPLFHAPRKARAIVVDLRGNGGAELRLIQCTLGVLIKASTTMFQVDLKDSEAEIFDAPALADTVPAKLPVIAFIDSKTDSGALLFAAVLGDLGRARVVGDPRHPESILKSVGNLVDFAEGLQISMPVGEIRRAQGRKLADGVDVAVEVESSAPIDKWLAAARSILERHE